MYHDIAINKWCQRRIRSPLFPFFFLLLEDKCAVSILKEDYHIHSFLCWISTEGGQDYIPGLNLLLGVSFWKASHSRAGNGIYWSPLTGCLFLWGPRTADSPGNTTSNLHSGLNQSRQTRLEALHQHQWLWRWTSRERTGPFQEQHLPEDQDLSWFIFLNQLLNPLHQSCCTPCCKLPLLSPMQIAASPNN